MTEMKCHDCGKTISSHPQKGCVYGGIDFKRNLILCGDCHLKRQRKMLEKEAEWEHMGEALANDIITQAEYDAWLKKTGGR